MARRGARAGVSVSLFSFQDIITCLSGIMILLVLLISLDMVIRKLQEDTMPRTEQSTDSLSKAGLVPHSKASVQLRDNSEFLKREINELEQQRIRREEEEIDLQVREAHLALQLKQLKEKADALLRDKSITLIPERGSRQKPWLVECSGEIIRMAKMSGKGATNTDNEPETFFTDSVGVRQFFRSLESVTKTEEYLLFMIKPSASEYVMPLMGRVRQLGFDVGYDALEEDRHLSFAEIRSIHAPTSMGNEGNDENVRGILPYGSGATEEEDHEKP